MTKHPGSFEAEREIPAVAVAPATAKQAAPVPPASVAAEAPRERGGRGQTAIELPPNPDGRRRVLRPSPLRVGMAMTIGRSAASTSRRDDAYVQADNVTIAPRCPATSWMCWFRTTKPF